VSASWSRTALKVRSGGKGGYSAVTGDAGAAFAGDRLSDRDERVSDTDGAVRRIDRDWYASLLLSVQLTRQRATPPMIIHRITRPPSTFFFPALQSLTVALRINEVSRKESYGVRGGPPESREALPGNQFVAREQEIHLFRALLSVSWRPRL